MSPERLEDLVTTTEGCHMRALAGVAELLAEAKRAREQEAFLRRALGQLSILSSVGFSSVKASLMRSYNGSAYDSEMPELAAFLRSASPASVEGVRE